MRDGCNRGKTGLPSRTEPLFAGDRWIPLCLVRNPRARRYVLRLTAEGGARVTIPRGGSVEEARSFARRHRSWLERQLRRRAEEIKRPREWLPGAPVHFRGDAVPLTLAEDHGRREVRFADQQVRLRDGEADLRPAVERHLWQLAARELPPRVFELAAAHGLIVRRVSVRNQRSRWGSCSRRGTISLNWRIIQAPPSVRDYLILHELMHLRHMNHSPRFWRAVAEVCPDYLAAENWLKQHALLLR